MKITNRVKAPFQLRPMFTAVKNQNIAGVYMILRQTVLGLFADCAVELGR